MFKCLFYLYSIYIYNFYTNSFTVLDSLHRECINLRDISVSGELLVSWKRMTWSKSPEGSKLAI